MTRRAEALAAARGEASSTPLERIDVAVGERFVADTHWPFFERLRREDPVHFTAESQFGPYWSITRFEDIVAAESRHDMLSSARGISIFDPDGDGGLPMFIASDPPKHDAQRAVVAPMFSSASVLSLEPLIRARAAAILDELPIGETFDWVDRVSIELTCQMLATLLDFPFEERRKLAFWSDLTATDTSEALTPEQAMAEFQVCGATFAALRAQRAAQAPRPDLISMLAHGEATRDLPFMEFIGNVLLLIVGGNDTTRNSLSGAVLAFDENPRAYARLRADPSGLASAVPEIIRWQSPVAHMRRTATADVEIGGKIIRAGDKVILWYVSGNRDETAIERPDDFIIDRARPRHHVSFGFGIHRCVGMRLAEMQLKVAWEEILARFPRIELAGEPERLRSVFLRGFKRLPVRIPDRA